MFRITNKQGNRIFFVAVFLIIIWMVFHQIHRDNDLKSNGIIVNVTVTNVLSNYKNIPSFKYEFFYKNVKYIKDNPTGIETYTFFIGRKFPAIFSPSTGNCELLMTPENFDKYDIAYPDSLQWVLQYRVN